VIPLSATGSTPVEIKGYVQNAYATWNPRPEFLLLVGWAGQVPAYNYHSGIYTDNYYADMTGDIHAELKYGRFPCRNARQCSVMVAKSLNYERFPYTTDTSWFKSGLTVVREDNDPDDTIYWDNAHIAIQDMRQSGFSRIDSLSRLRGHTASDVVNSVNAGKSFLMYRGVGTVNWYTPFAVDPGQTGNGYRLPVVLSATCMTVTLAPNESMIGDGWLRAGTVAAPKGAVAFFGNTHADSHVAQLRGAVARGFMQAYFVDSVGTLGEAALAGKNRLYAEYGSEVEYQGFNLLGDPTLQYRTAAPFAMQVLYDSAVPIGSSNMSVRVLRNGQPLAHALVCARKSGEFYACDSTDGNGESVLPIAPSSPGEIEVTVTARNALPYEGLARAATIDAATEAILAPIGNLDSGAVVVPQATVRNNGTESASFWTRMTISNQYRDSVWVSSLEPASLRSVSFTQWSARGQGSLAVRCTVALSGDQQPANSMSEGSVTVNSRDVGVTAIQAPASFIPPGPIAPRLTIYNYGPNAVNPSVVFSISDVGGSPVYRDTQMVSGLAPGETREVGFSEWTATDGLYQAACRSCLSGDINPTNDTLSLWFAVVSHDAGATRIVSPAQIITMGDTVEPRVMVHNFGGVPESFHVSFAILVQDSSGDRLVFGDSVSVTLPAGESTAVDFSAWVPSQAGECIAVAATNLRGDINPGNDTIRQSLSVYPPTGVDEGVEQVAGHEELSVRPNPSSAGVVLMVNPGRSARATLSVVDVAGRTISLLYAGGMRAGRQIIKWNGTDGHGIPVRAGVYFARLDTEKGTIVKKLVRN
jgi:hypothetical protein